MCNVQTVQTADTQTTFQNNKCKTSKQSDMFKYISLNHFYFSIHFVILISKLAKYCASFIVQTYKIYHEMTSNMLTSVLSILFVWILHKCNKFLKYTPNIMCIFCKWAWRDFVCVYVSFHLWFDPYQLTESIETIGIFKCRINPPKLDIEKWSILYYFIVQAENLAFHIFYIHYVLSHKWISYNN